MHGWSESEWLTLQLGPVWIVSALTGRSFFDDLEEEAFWRAVDQGPETSPLSWQLTQAMVRNKGWLVSEFMLEDRSIVTGLSQIAALLERVPHDSRETRETMLRIGAGFARARGPFGQRMSDQDAQLLQLTAQLLETAAETAANNPLNAARAI